MSQWAPFKEAVISGILCKRSAGARSRRLHLIDPRESACLLPPPSLPPPSPCVLVLLCALWVSSRTNCGGLLDHQKFAKYFLKVPGPGPEWFGVCFLGTGVLYKYYFFLVFWQLNHGDSKMSPCAAVRFPVRSANPGPKKQVCG